MPDASFIPPVIDGIEGLQPLGRGGCATVWVGVRVADGRTVAVKVPRGEHATREFLERFDEECELIRRLRPHPNVVPVLGRTRARLEDGSWTPALVMEVVPGARSLLEYADDQKLDLLARLRLFRNLCAGVAHLHRAGVMHLDLKPSNVLVDSAGVPHVADLGAAKILLNNDARRSFFTPQYASPEQLAGEPAALEQTSDVYSLGKILAALIAGDSVLAPPHGQRDTAQRSSAAIGWDANRLLDHVDDPDPALWRIVARATARQPSERHADARELVAEIDELLRPWPLRVGRHAVAAFTATPRGARRAGGRAVVAAGAVVLALAATFFGALTLLSVAGSSDPARGPLRLDTAAPAALSRVVVVEIAPGTPVEELAAAAGASGLDPAALGTFRSVQAALVDRLAAAEAAAIGIDVEFPRNAAVADATARLVAATARSIANGCPVVVGVRRLDNDPDAEFLEPALRQVVTDWGTMGVCELRGADCCLPLVAVPDRGAPALGFALALIRAAERSAQPRLDRERGDVVLLRRGGAPLRLPPYETRPIEGWRDGEVVLFASAPTLAGAQTAVRHIVYPTPEVLEAATLDALEVLTLPLKVLRDRIDGRMVVVTNNIASGDLDPLRTLGGRPLLKAWNHAVLIESVLSPELAPPSSGPALALMGVAAIAGACLAAPLTSALRRRPRWRSSAGRRPRIAGATLGLAILLLASGWAALALLRPGLSFVLVSTCVALIFGIVLGALASTRRWRIAPHSFSPSSPS